MIGRREAIIRLGVGAAGLLAGGRRALLAAPGVGPEIVDIAEQLRAATIATSFQVATRLIRSGVDWKTMLGAIFLCGVRGIRPRPHGILHCVMMVESSFQLAESSPNAAWLPVLWNLHDFKLSQEQNRIEADDWELQPLRSAPRLDAAGARREFIAAMDAWDVERADRAVVALARTTTLSDLFEIVWPIACRCYAFIGHKMIYAAQVARVIRRLGEVVAEPALRSLTRALLVNRNTSAFASSRDLAAGLPPEWERGKEEPQRSLDLLRERRRLAPRQSQEHIVEAFRAGLGPRTVWDSLRLQASELFLHRPGRSASAGRSALLPVHCVTVTNALAYAHANARSEQTRRLTILQAAGWLSSLRDDLRDIVQLAIRGPGIEALAPSIPAHYLAELRASLFRTGQEHHQYKYAAAVAEESAAVDARWAPYILAPAAEYLANPNDVETETYRQSMDALHTVKS